MFTYLVFSQQFICWSQIALIPKLVLKSIRCAVQKGSHIDIEEKKDRLRNLQNG